MRSRFLQFTASVLLAAFCAAATPMHAAESVWSGLVMANNAPEPTPIPAELNRFEGTLKQLFGYNQFEVIGESRNTLGSGEENWLASSKYFSLHVDSKAVKSAKKPSYLLNLQLFQEEKLLLRMDTELSKARPVVIKGPQVGNGQLVLLLVVE